MTFQRSTQQLLNLVSANAGDLIRMLSCHIKTVSHTTVTPRFPHEKAPDIFIPELFPGTGGI